MKFYGLNENNRVIELGEFIDKKSAVEENKNNSFTFSEDMLKKTSQSIIDASDNGEIVSLVYGFTYEGLFEELPSFSDVHTTYYLAEDSVDLDKYFMFFSNDQISTIFYDIQGIL